MPRELYEAAPIDGAERCAAVPPRHPAAHPAGDQHGGDAAADRDLAHLQPGLRDDQWRARRLLARRSSITSTRSRSCSNAGLRLGGLDAAVRSRSSCSPSLQRCVLRRARPWLSRRISRRIRARLRATCRSGSSAWCWRRSGRRPSSGWSRPRSSPPAQVMTHDDRVAAARGDLRQLRQGASSIRSPRWAMNSLIQATVATALCVLFGAMAGYALARLRFPGRDLLFLLFLASLMVPTEVSVVPMLLAFIKIGWAITYQALILPMIGNVFCGLHLPPVLPDLSQGARGSRHRRRRRPLPDLLPDRPAAGPLAGDRRGGDRLHAELEQLPVAAARHLRRGA